MTDLTLSELDGANEKDVERMVKEEYMKMFGTDSPKSEEHIPLSVPLRSKLSRTLRLGFTLSRMKAFFLKCKKVSDILIRPVTSHLHPFARVKKVKRQHRCAKRRT